MARSCDTCFATLLQDIASGGYVEEEDELASALKSLAPQIVCIRFGHEKDVVDAPYPWATRDAPAYVAAFRQQARLLFEGEFSRRRENG